MPAEVPALPRGRLLLALWRDATLRPWLLAQLFVVLVTAWRSETFFHPDEHFQVIEFASHLLGWTPADALPWEFRAQMRPWLQPLAYAGVMRALAALGLRDPFRLLTVLRLLTALFAWLVYNGLLSHLVAQQTGAVARRRLVQLSVAVGFLPYLMARTSSETAAASFAVLSLLALDLAELHPPPMRLPRVAFAGLLAGLAFECRFQLAFLFVGTTLWWLWHRRPPVAAVVAFLAGNLAALGLGALADRIGYGTWCFPPYAYVQQNVVQNVAASFGVEPLPAYLWLLPANLFAPIVVVSMVLLGRVWWQKPRSALAWGSLAFVLAHTLVGHKEERFLFPLAFLLPWIFAESLPLASLIALPKWTRPLLVWNCLLLLLFAVYPVGWRPHHAFFRHMASDDAPHQVLIRDAQPFIDTPFLTPKSFEVRLEGRDPPPQTWSGWQLLTPDAFAEPLPPPGTHARLVWSEMPLRTTSAWQHVGPLVAACVHAWEAHTPSALPRPTWLTLYALEAEK